MLYVIYVICVIYVIYDIYDMYGALTFCLYGCQKKRKDLWNAANHLRFPKILCFGQKTEISWCRIFPLYISEFPLYILLHFSVMKIVTLQIEIFGTCY